jgi:hypothetical protein
VLDVRKGEKDESVPANYAEIEQVGNPQEFSHAGSNDHCKELA